MRRVRDESVAPEGLTAPERDAVRGPGRVAGGLLTSLFVLVIVAAGLTFVPLPYVTLAPGPATNVLGTVDGTPVLTIDGAPTYPTEGSLDFTTVVFDGGPGRKVTVYEVLGGWLSPEVDVVPEERYFPPDATAEEVESANTAMMNESQVTAAAVALRALGQDVPTTVLVAQVVSDGPSDGRLEAGDEILAVDGTEVRTGDEVRDVVQPTEPGTTLPITVLRDGERRTVEVTTAAGDDGRSVIGVLLGEGYDLPITVTLNTGRVGGPSAGLMFALAIYDSLTPGSLTGGEAVAGTGEIEDDGSVGPISGVAQKMVGAREAGAEWFLAPAEECAATEGRVPEGMTVLRAATFDEALAAVEGIAAGDTAGLPRCG